MQPWWTWAATTTVAMVEFCKELLNISFKKNPVVWPLLLLFEGNAILSTLLSLYDTAFAQILIVPGLILAALVVTSTAALKWWTDNKVDGLYYSLSFMLMAVCLGLNIAAVMGVIHQTSLFANIYIIGVVGEFVCALMAINMRSIVDQKHHDAIKYSLKGAIADKQIEKIIERGAKLLDSPTHQYITVMSIDVVGYSMLYRRLLPMKAFESMKDLFSGLTDIIHQYNGIIDKSLGDGILCFFGYELTGETLEEHEWDAVKCAHALQHYVVQLAILRGDKGEGVFPLRIGINSADVFLGNMGDSTRYDLTLTGEGVVLSNKFESACEPFKVILGKSTFDHLPHNEVQGGFSPILIPLKHEGSLIEAYEFNPFEKSPDILGKAKQHYWQLNMLEKKERRLDCNEPLTVDSSHGIMQVLNFSLGGFCLCSTNFFARGTKFDLNLSSVVDDLRAKHVSPLAVEVAWSMPHGNGSYRHGVKIIGANSKKRGLVFSLLRQML